jgi:hypothetical protein
MTYKEALELANQKEYLIGQTWNGARIDDIIIYPSAPELQESYWKGYVDCGYDSKKAVLPYVNMDLSVGFFDKKRFHQGFLIGGNIEDVKL